MRIAHPIPWPDSFPERGGIALCPPRASPFWDSHAENGVFSSAGAEVSCGLQSGAWACGVVNC